VAFVFNIEGLIPTLDIDLLHMLESLLHQNIFDVLHVPVLSTEHYFFSDFGVLCKDFTSQELLTQRNGFDIGSCEVNKL
jgi:hypothetical protein